jgi:hypothetical protein
MMGRNNQTDSIAMKAEGHRESLVNTNGGLNLEILQDCGDVFVLPHEMSGNNWTVYIYEGPYGAFSEFAIRGKITRRGSLLHRNEV